LGESVSFVEKTKAIKECRSTRAKGTGEVILFVNFQSIRLCKNITKRN